MYSSPNCQIFTVILSLKLWLCSGTVLCVPNTKSWLFYYSVMCSGGWKHSRVHPIKRLPLVCVWFWVTMRTIEPGVTIEAVGNNWLNAFRLASESQSGSHKWVLPHSPRQLKTAGKAREQPRNSLRRCPWRLRMLVHLYTILLTPESPVPSSSN